jgi:CRISPR-associated protein Csd1
MILQTLYDLALREGLMEDPDFDWAPVHLIIELHPDGRLAEVIDQRGEKGKGERTRVPRFPKRSGQGMNPQFLVDNAKYVLGLPDLKKRNEPKDLERAEQTRQAFFERVSAAADATGDEGLQAVSAFLASSEERARLFAKAPPDTWTTESIAFRLVTDSAAELVHLRPAVRQFWSASRRPVDQAAGPQVRCLVTGALTRPAATHPNIKRLPEGQSSGTALVTFNASAFESQGFKQGDNAPVSPAAAEGYVAAINHLLEREGERPYRQGVRIGDAIMLFWTREASGFASAFIGFFEATAEDWRALLESAFTGQAATADPDRFYALTLSANAARTVVRDWFTASTQEVAGRLTEYVRDFALEPHQEHPVAIRTLLSALEDRAGKGVPDDLATRLFGAALRGAPLPLSLLTIALRRMRMPPGPYDRDRLHARVALIKAILLRHTRHSPSPREISMALDAANTEPAYLLGRLFAALERLQAAALGDLNASIRDKFFGAASSTPGTVFPRLLRLSMHHAAKAERAGWLEKLIGEIMTGLPAARFPGHLTLEEQGLFAIGYYHQRQVFFTKKTETADTTNPTD